jgi:hypothetical protein
MIIHTARARYNDDEQAIADLAEAGKFDEIFVRVFTLDGKQADMSVSLFAAYCKEALEKTPLPKVEYVAPNDNRH